MKKFWEISAPKVTAGLIGWLIATNLLVGLTHLTDWWPYKIVLFLCLSFLPGVALLRALRIALGTFSAGVLYSFGLSILVLMLSGLAANQILYMFGVPRPLELLGALGAWNMVTAIIIVVSIFTNSRGMRLKKWSIKELSKPTWLLLGLSLLLPCIAVLGAFRLNNGGDALFAGFTLCFAAGLIVCAFVLRHRLPDGLLAWLIFVIGLSILLMTSFRGWDMVGHDIQHEFRVYTLTHIHGHWDIELDRDPYNACLSITILPEMFARLLDISGIVVFKVILQIIFAACPVVLYLLLRQYVPKLGALTGSMLFICYPTFINDSAMLTRQGVAYLFFALALLVMTNKTIKLRYQGLFLLCALGVVLSHYSTAYMFVALFVVAAICKLCITWWQIRRDRSLHRTMQPTVLSPLFAVLLFFMTFTWYAQVTATSGGLTMTLQKSFANIPNLFSSDNDNKSSDTSIALLFAGGKTQADLYQSYLADSQYRKQSSDTANLAQYTPVLTSDDLPLTPLGEKARSFGVDPASILALRQNFARVLQVFALLGVVYATYRWLRKKPSTLGPDFICLSLAGVMLLALLVALPVLSINYGILRAFHQSLIFLILPITLLLVWLGQRMWSWLSTTIATLGIVLLFLLFTGMFAQVLGGTSPSLSMNNRGLYYGLYYSSEADFAGYGWLKEHVPKSSDARAANFNEAFMHDPQYPFSKVGILPSQIGPSTYVYLDQAQILTKKVYTYHESSPLIMTFPLEYYDDTKNQIYSTTSTRIYR